MGRMLDALRQIESHNSRNSVLAQKDAPRPSDAQTDGVSRQETTEASAVAKENASYEAEPPQRGTREMESLLVEAETAAAEALDGVAVEPSEFGAEFDGASCPPLQFYDEISQSCNDHGDCAETEKGVLADPLSDLAGTVLRAMAGQPTCFLFTSPDSNSLGADLLVPLSTSLRKRFDGDLLLIDTNLRRPLLASRLGVDASRGLTDVLGGAAGWQDVVRRTILPGVDLLPAVPFSTPAGPRPARLNLDRLLAEARNRYRLILIHAASLQHPEVAPIAGSCDGVYLVVRLHSTARRAAAEAVRLLRQAGGNVLGCMVVQ